MLLTGHVNRGSCGILEKKVVSSNARLLVTPTCTCYVYYRHPCTQFFSVVLIYYGFSEVALNLDRLLSALAIG